MDPTDQWGRSASTSSQQRVRAARASERGCQCTYSLAATGGAPRLLLTDVPGDDSARIALVSLVYFPCVPSVLMPPPRPGAALRAGGGARAASRAWRSEYGRLRARELARLSCRVVATPCADHCDVRLRPDGSPPGTSSCRQAGVVLQQWYRASVNGVCSSRSHCCVSSSPGRTRRSCSCSGSSKLTRLTTSRSRSTSCSKLRGPPRRLPRLHPPRPPHRRPGRRGLCRGSARACATRRRVLPTSALAAPHPQESSAH